MFYERWVAKEVSIIGKGKKGYLFGKLWLGRFKQKISFTGLLRTDLKISGQKNCVVSVSHIHEKIHHTFCIRMGVCDFWRWDLWWNNLPSFEKNPLLLLTICTTPITLQDRKIKRTVLGLRKRVPNWVKYTLNYTKNSDEIPQQHNKYKRRYRWAELEGDWHGLGYACGFLNNCQDTQFSKFSSFVCHLYLQCPGDVLAWNAAHSLAI